MINRFSHVWLFETPWTVARQAPLSMGFSRQEYWSGLPCPPPRDLPNPGIEAAFLTSPALAGRFFTASVTRDAVSVPGCARCLQTLLHLLFISECEMSEKLSWFSAIWTPPSWCRNTAFPPVWSPPLGHPSYSSATVFILEALILLRQELLQSSFFAVFLDCCCSVAELCPTLKPHGLQHARLPCPSLSPRVCWDSCPLSWWCHPAISSSVIPFSYCLQSFPTSGSFPMSQFFTSGGQSIGASTSASVLPMNIQGYPCLLCQR